jgi:hypothetical protein
MRGISERGYCATHVRSLRASGSLLPLRPNGGAGRLSALLPGEMPAELRHARATPLARWLKRGILSGRDGKAIHRHCAGLVHALSQSLGGSASLSAMQLAALENIALSRATVLLALSELAERPAFGPNSNGDRVASAGYAALVRALAESRQQLAQIGMDRKAVPLTFDAIVKEAAEQAEADAKNVTDAELAAPAEPSIEAQS